MDGGSTLPPERMRELFELPASVPYLKYSYL